MKFFSFGKQQRETLDSSLRAQKERIKVLVKQLENLHWTRQDIRVGSLDHLAILVCIWSEIQNEISQNVEIAREFIRRGGLQRIFWYVEEKKIATKSDELVKVFEEILTVLENAMVDDEGNRLFKEKYYGCREIVEKRLHN